MNWTPEPATERQLSYLKRLGHNTDRPLSRMEAAQLIREFQDQQAAKLQERSQALVQHEPYQLHLKAERARAGASAANGGSSADSDPALAERQEFWLDTCREVAQMRFSCGRVLDLYKKYGCRFQVPTHRQVQDILDALDAAAPAWDQEHFELFYQTLELNYPALARHF